MHYIQFAIYIFYHIVFIFSSCTKIANQKISANFAMHLFFWSSKLLVQTWSPEQCHWNYKIRTISDSFHKNGGICSCCSSKWLNWLLIHVENEQNIHSLCYARETLCCKVSSGKYFKSLINKGMKCNHWVPEGLEFYQQITGILQDSRSSNFAPREIVRHW